MLGLLLHLFRTYESKIKFCFYMLIEFVLINDVSSGSRLLKLAEEECLAGQKKGRWPKIFFF